MLPSEQSAKLNARGLGTVLARDSFPLLNPIDVQGQSPSPTVGYNGDSF